MYKVAFDIGTTTLDMSLLDAATGKVLAEEKSLNPQRKSGQDVLTRILYEQKFQKIAIRRMQQLVVGEMENLIGICCKRAGILSEDITEIVVAANCVMAHMLLGVDASSMGQAPYEPVFLAAQCVTGQELGLDLVGEAKVYVLPHAAAFFGGDVVAGMVCAHPEEGSLFLDIGTNGEMALLTKAGILACSCAVGPALEGMNIRCGMVAKPGAIEKVSLGEEETFSLQVIGEEAPKGLCGSGVLSAICTLLEAGILDETGLLSGEKQEIYLSREPDVCLTQKDIRQVQLAKGAILAAVKALLQEGNCTMEEISKVYVAGQFGQHVSEALLLGAGLLPKEAAGKVVYLGNTARKGAECAALSDKTKGEMERLAEQITYVELANLPSYMELFMESMNF